MAARAGAAAAESAAASVAALNAEVEAKQRELGERAAEAAAALAAEAAAANALVIWGLQSVFSPGLCLELHHARQQAAAWHARPELCPGTAQWQADKVVTVPGGRLRPGMS